MKVIDPADLVDIQALAAEGPSDLRVILAYAQGDHPLNHVFREPIYRADARMWMHKDLAAVTLRAAAACRMETGNRFVLLDCLRTTDAQAKMAQTKIVRANPHWTQPGPNQLLSNPGEGAHPRGMAVDIMLEREDGSVVNMGTVFDHFSEDPTNNPAARDYPMPDDIAANRRMLCDYMVNAGHALGVEIWPLPSEWWDFRFPADIYNAYAPLSDADLPPEMKMCS